MAELIFDRVIDAAASVDPTASADAVGSVHESLALPFAARQKARQRVQLASGRDAGLKLPRGTVLRGGDLLQSDCGTVVRVEAAPETVSIVRTADPHLLARAAYHLGNRHVWVEVGDGWLSYLADHVLDDMLRGLGVAPEPEKAPFEPEAGAYSGHGSGNGHAAPHEHSHGPH